MSCFEIIQLNNIRLILKTTPRPLRLLSAHWDHCDRSLGGKGGHDESIVIFSFQFFVDVNFDINFQNGAAESARCCPQPNVSRKNDWVACEKQEFNAALNSYFWQAIQSDCFPDMHFWDGDCTSETTQRRSERFCRNGFINMRVRSPLSPPRILQMGGGGLTLL